MSQWDDSTLMYPDEEGTLPGSQVQLARSAVEALALEQQQVLAQQELALRAAEGERKAKLIKYGIIGVVAAIFLTGWRQPSRK